MIRDAIASLTVGALAFLFLSALAFAHPSPDCVFIREKVKEHGRIAAYAWAISQGYSPKDIARIRKICGV